MTTLILTLAAGGLFLMSRAFRGLIALLVVAMLCAGFYNVAKESPAPQVPVVNVLETEYVPRVFESSIEVEELPAPPLASENSDNEQIPEHDGMLDTSDDR